MHVGTNFRPTWLLMLRGLGFNTLCLLQQLPSMSGAALRQDSSFLVIFIIFNHANNTVWRAEREPGILMCQKPDISHSVCSLEHQSLALKGPKRVYWGFCFNGNTGGIHAAATGAPDPSNHTDDCLSVTVLVCEKQMLTYMLSQEIAFPIIQESTFNSENIVTNKTSIMKSSPFNCQLNCQNINSTHQVDYEFIRHNYEAMHETAGGPLCAF